MLQRLKEFWRGGEAGLLAGAASPQVGVIPYAVKDGEVALLLITSRRTGRWIFPKGGVEQGETAEACAAREAWEEAGVEGAVSGEAVGAYRDRKVHPRRARVIEVEMYPFRVDRQRQDWPEQGDRQRHWATLEEARALVTTPGLIELAETVCERALSRRLPGRAG